LFISARTGLVLAFALSVALGLWLLTMQTKKSVNVILITVDTLRADHLGAYGYQRATSPHVDAFARESLLFRRAYSQSSETNPSLSSLMTSYYPHETKVLRIFHQLPPGVLTLAEILKAEGYRTGAVVSNFTLRHGAGFEQGFDTYDDQMEDWGSKNWEGYDRVGPKTTTAAQAWLRSNHATKFFLWIHYMDPHSPYTPPAPYSKMFVDYPGDGAKSIPFNKDVTGMGGIPPDARLGDHADPRYYISQYSQYDGEIAFFDHWFGELLKTIRELNLFENTLILFTADHGEAMGEHNYYFAHLESLYEGLIHVPLLMRVPGPSSAGREITYPVAHIDLLPTILDVLSIQHPRTFRGQNLLTPNDREIFAEANYGGAKATLISHGMKLISSGYDYEEYDLEKDPEEKSNLLETLPDAEFLTVAGLQRTLTSLVQQDALELGAPMNWNIELEIERKLKALGYVQ
jgi:arylsulfatase